MRRCRRRSARPAATGATCLSAAVSGKREAIVARLLDAGVDVDQPLPGGSTPLMVADTEDAVTEWLGDKNLGLATLH